MQILWQRRFLTSRSYHSRLLNSRACSRATAVELSGGALAGRPRPMLLSVCSKGASKGIIKKNYWEYKQLDGFIIYELVGVVVGLLSVVCCLQQLLLVKGAVNRGCEGYSLGAKVCVPPEVATCYSGVRVARTVQHENEDILPRQFHIEPQQFPFTCMMNLADEDRYIAMRGLQFPVISNTCTTGHKLQGCTVDSILANGWYYGANWAYVVLSRVRTMKGLSLTKRLTRDLQKYPKPETMKRMLKRFSETIEMEMISDKEYDSLLENDHFIPSLRPELYTKEPADAF